MSLIPGLPYPLGATLRDGGVNFAVASDRATAIELCTFDAGGEEQRERLPGHDDGVWHGFLARASAGLRYGFRAHGPWAPSEGHFFNPNKLLLDPYAREVVGEFVWDDAHYGYVRGDASMRRDTRDNAALMPKARVAAPLDGPPPVPLRVPAADTVIYELHVKGFSKLNPAIPEPLRGTYAGLAHPASIAHLQALGVTTVELLPVQHAISERRLVALGLSNYWGYNPIAWFCPDPRLSSTPSDPTATRAEFRAMVAALHAAGLEVLLDVVFNHSAEAGETGPTLSLRGLDETLYYRHEHGDPQRCVNWTGCGNTLNFHQPRVVQLTLDALRHWVEEFGVDGFRFDLAPTLGRTHVEFDPVAPLFVALAQDPTLAGIKLIAEPWDLGPHGYRLGGFPRRWLEWNDRYRDCVRRFWLHRDVDRAELARRIAGSSDVFARELRAPTASLNLVTAHDGFTLADLVSYARKHNLANAEDNRDGHTNNHSVNCGVEGPTEDPQILGLRRDRSRALLATLLCSRGTPMLLAGDELGRTQRGNNNAYCQDNAISWIDWSTIDASLLAYVQQLIALRRDYPALRWLPLTRVATQGVAGGPGGPPGCEAFWGGCSGSEPEPLIEWLRPDGEAMGVEDWHDTDEHALMVRLGDLDDALLLLFNAELAPREFVLPPGVWTIVLCSARAAPEQLDDRVIAPAHAVVVLAAQQ
ncbi:MAG TPA: glycogen debranching protein GlgX [Enhygromyxa sp.]|nr:glycogen debranching protein GlgX [Enhygromyxa sp.]